MKFVTEILQLNGFGQAAWCFILSIYKARWNILKTDDNNRIFRQNVISKFTLKTNTKTNSKVYKSNKKDNLLNKEKHMEVIRVSLSIPLRSSKETLEKIEIS